MASKASHPYRSRPVGSADERTIAAIDRLRDNAAKWRDAARARRTRIKELEQSLIPLENAIAEAIPLVAAASASTPHQYELISRKAAGARADDLVAKRKPAQATPAIAAKALLDTLQLSGQNFKYLLIALSKISDAIVNYVAEKAKAANAEVDLKPLKTLLDENMLAKVDRVASESRLNSYRNKIKGIIAEEKKHQAELSELKKQLETVKAELRQEDDAARSRRDRANQQARTILITEMMVQAEDYSARHAELLIKQQEVLDSIDKQQASIEKLARLEAELLEQMKPIQFDVRGKIEKEQELRDRLDLLIQALKTNNAISKKQRAKIVNVIKFIHQHKLAHYNEQQFGKFVERLRELAKNNFKSETAHSLRPLLEGAKPATDIAITTEKQRLSRQEQTCFEFAEARSLLQHAIAGDSFDFSLAEIATIRDALKELNRMGLLDEMQVTDLELVLCPTRYGDALYDGPRSFGMAHSGMIDYLLTQRQLTVSDAEMTKAARAILSEYAANYHVLDAPDKPESFILFAHHALLEPQWFASIELYAETEENRDARNTLIEWVTAELNAPLHLGNLFEKRICLLQNAQQAEQLKVIIRTLRKEYLKAKQAYQLPDYLTEFDYLKIRLGIFDDIEKIACPDWVQHMRQNPMPNVRQQLAQRQKIIQEYRQARASRKLPHTLSFEKYLGFITAENSLAAENLLVAADWEAQLQASTHFRLPNEYAALDAFLAQNDTTEKAIAAATDNNWQANIAALARLHPYNSLEPAQRVEQIYALKEQLLVPQTVLVSEIESIWRAPESAKVVAADNASILPDENIRNIIRQYLIAKRRYAIPTSCELSKYIECITGEAADQELLAAPQVHRLQPHIQCISATRIFSDRAKHPGAIANTARLDQIIALGSATEAFTDAALDEAEPVINTRSDALVCLDRVDRLCCFSSAGRLRGSIGGRGRLGQKIQDAVTATAIAKHSTKQQDSAGKVSALEQELDRLKAEEAAGSKLHALLVTQVFCSLVQYKAATQVELDFRGKVSRWWDRGENLGSGVTGRSRTESVITLLSTLIQADNYAQACLLLAEYIEKNSQYKDESHMTLMLQTLFGAGGVLSISTGKQLQGFADQIDSLENKFFDGEGTFKDQARVRKALLEKFHFTNNKYEETVGDLKALSPANLKQSLITYTNQAKSKVDKLDGEDRKRFLDATNMSSRHISKELGLSRIRGDGRSIFGHTLWEGHHRSKARSCALDILNNVEVEAEALVPAVNPRFD